MMRNEYKMTSMDRISDSLDFKEPDRVPISFNLTLQAAKEMNISLKTFFSDPEKVAEGQLLMLEKYGFDTVTSSYYGGLETEAWGGSVKFYEDGPPNVNKLIIQDFEDIFDIDVPNVYENKNTQKVIRTTEILKDNLADDVPIMGGIISPFSLPITQMGFSKYFELLYEKPILFEELMKKNMDFSVEFANAQLKAGAEAIGYADPASSPDIIPYDLFLQTGFKIMQKALNKINGDVAIGFASARCFELLDDIMKTNAVGIVPSVKEDLARIKKKCYEELTIIGNLNAIEMINWTKKEIEVIIKTVIKKAGKGGGFILSDNHGEIPYQVPEQVLIDIKKAVEKYGTYS